MTESRISGDNGRAGDGGRPAPSDWVRRFAGLIEPPGPVLDLAAGSGRHTRLLLDLGYKVTALDRKIDKLADLAQASDLAEPGDLEHRAEIVRADLEGGGPFVLAGRAFAGIVVTNYLHRPLMSALLACISPGGLLIYETFARGNERFGKPANPAFLLAPGELLALVQGAFRVLAYEDLTVEQPRPAAIQRICARKL